MKRSPGPFCSKGFDMTDFRGRVAVVTGAASGIGLGAVERFLSEGMKVVMADIEKAGLDRQVSRLTDAGGEVLGVVCGVRDLPGAHKRTLRHTVEHAVLAQKGNGVVVRDVVEADL